MKKSKLFLLFFLTVSILCAALFTACKEEPAPSESPSATPSVSVPAASVSPTVSAEPAPSGSPSVTPTQPPQPSEEGPHSHRYGKVENGSTFTMECSCGDVATGYRIQFVYAEDGSQADPDIEVSWIDESGYEFTAKTDDFGYVEALRLPAASYKISVDEDTLPEIDGVRYLFNKSAFLTQENGVGLTIPLLAVYEPSNLEDPEITGRLEHTGDRYAINLNKTYIATLTGPADVIWYTVQNEGFGKYTVDASMAEGVTLEINRHFANVAYVVDTPDSDADTSVANQLTYTVVYTDGPQDSTFCMKATEAASYPVSVPFSVSITFVPEDESVDGETLIRPTFFETRPDTYVYYVEERGTGQRIEMTADSLAPVEGVAKWQDSEGSVIQNLTEEQLGLMQLKEDGYYYVGGNQIVFAKLDAPSIFEASTLASYLFDSAHRSIYQVTEYDEFGCCILFDNYFGLVQAYTALANSDGLYPLTEELYDFLNIIAQKEHQTVNLLLCTYPTQINPWQQGAGTEESPYLLALGEQTFGNYNLSVPAEGKTYVTFQGNADIALTFSSDVKATVNGSSYSDYITVEGEVTVAFESKIGAAKDFVLAVEEYDDPYYLEIGANEIYALPDAEVSYEFVSPAAGSYDIGVSSSNVKIFVQQGEAGEPMEMVGTMTFLLEEGQSLFITVETTLTMQVDFTLSVEVTPENE